MVYCANSLELCINTIGSFYCECQQGYQRVNNTCRGWPLFIIFRIVNRVLKIENLSPFTLHRSSKQERLRCTKIAPLNGELRSSKFIKRKILKVTWNFFIVKYVVVRHCVVNNTFKREVIIIFFMMWSLWTWVTTLQLHNTGYRLKKTSSMLSKCHDLHTQ